MKNSRLLIPRHYSVFISFEGIEGSGKSTHATMLHDFLQKAQISTLLTREPGGSWLGTELRKILLRPDTVTVKNDPSLTYPKLSATAETLLFAADRAQHVSDVIKPALERDQCVITDRYVDSGIAYQGFGNDQSTSDVMQINALAINHLLPDVTFLCDVPVEIGLLRARLRNKHNELEHECRFEEKELGFHRRIQKGYAYITSKNRPATFSMKIASDADVDDFLADFKHEEYRKSLYNVAVVRRFFIMDCSGQVDSIQERIRRLAMGMFFKEVKNVRGRRIKANPAGESK